MNTIEGYTKQSNQRAKISKRELLERVKLLEDVAQALIDHIAGKEKVQMGVMATSACAGVKYILYQQPLAICSLCLKDLPPQKQGDEIFKSDGGALLCYECYSKIGSEPK